MHELTIPRSKLTRSVLWQSRRRGCGCLTGHVLRASGIAARKLLGNTYSFQAECVPDSIVALVEPVAGASSRRFTLTLEARARVVAPFDNGNEGRALRNLRAYGWNVTIQEDA